MATRPVYFPVCNFVRKEEIEFEWVRGDSDVQKQKLAKSLHDAAIEKYPGFKLLDVCSQSSELLGKIQSAFNLHFCHKEGAFPFECVYQSSKVFENGGPYRDILYMDPHDAKHDPRLKSSGKLIGFNLYDEMWDVDTTAFYDYHYIKAILEQPLPIVEGVKHDLSQYDGFTDIVAGTTGFATQAKTCAIFVSLVRQDLLDYYMQSPEKFKTLYTNHKYFDMQEL